MDNQTPPIDQQPDQQSQPQPEETAQPVVAVADTSAADSNAVFSEIAKKIIEQQEVVIGPIAVEQAKQVPELTINWPQVTVIGNPQKAIDDLVQKYKELFGQIAVQVSRDASVSLLAQLPLDKHPKSLSA
jgi:hypothetical protein